MSEPASRGTSPKAYRGAIDLNTTYKKPIPVPGPVLCTARIERQEGRKLYIRATIEDGAGTVYTTGECMFVRVNPKL